MTATLTRNVFKVKQSALKEAIAAVMPSIPSKPSHPILACMVLDLRNKRLKGFDLRLAIDVRLEAEFEGSLGEIAIPAKRFQDVINKMPDSEIEIVVDQEVISLKSLTEDVEFEVRLNSLEEYPIIEVANTESATVASTVLMEAFKLIAFTSDEESKQILQGVNLSVEDALLSAYATNGHFCGKYRDALGSASDIEKTTIPGEAVKALVKLIQMDEYPELDISIEGCLVSFRSSNFELTTRILDGQYPNVEQLVPRQFSKVVKVDRDALLKQLDRASVMTKENNDIVILDISGDEISIFSRDAETGKASLKLPCELRGDGIKIAFNLKYLIACLKVMPMAEATLSMNTPKSPCVVQSSGDERMTTLLMPIQIRE
jgi:DNA polymerase III subunit beta